MPVPATPRHNSEPETEVERDIDPYPGAFVSLPWSEDYNPYDYELTLKAWRRVLARVLPRA